MPPDLGPLKGVWESCGPDGSTGTLTLWDAGEGVRMHERLVHNGQAHQVDLVLLPDGETRDVGGRPMRTVLSNHHLLTELRLEQGPLRVSRTVDADELVVRQTLGDQRSEVRYQRSSVKQVMIYRRDLKMRKGKIAAQCAHGSMAVFFRRDRGQTGRLDIPIDGPMEVWSRAGFAKIVLSTESETDLLAIQQAAEAAGLPNAVITDSGRTEFHGVPTRTVVAIGPAARGEIDRITGPDGAVACKLA